MYDIMPHHGWRSRGYLPHLEAPELIQSLTFRLADSLPAHLLRSLASGPFGDRAIESALHAGRGACWLARADIATVVEGTLLHFDGDRYRILAWCIMPNHVHVLIETVPGHEVGSVVRSWKSYSAGIANRKLGRTGAFWCLDYFDRFIRNQAHLDAVVAYIENNPVKVGLAASPVDWQWSSARRR